MKNSILPSVIMLGAVALSILNHIGYISPNLFEWFITPLLLLLLSIPSLILGFFGLNLQRGLRRKPVFMAFSFSLLAVTFLWDILTFSQLNLLAEIIQRIGYILSTVFIYLSISVTTTKTTLFDMVKSRKIERRLMDYFETYSSKETEIHLDESLTTSLKPGFIYLVKEKKPSHSLDLFVDEMDKGCQGLLITRTHPKQIRDQFAELRKIPILWLTDSRRVDKHTTINPQPEQIFAVIDTFIEKSPNGIVLLDGVEYLINYNNFDLVLHLVEQIRDIVSAKNARFILSLHPGTLKRLELNLLERETHIIEE
ncbi:MAG: DUF835 domain-containing protein [Candidatus Altiarchaeota archaeon]